MGYLNPPMEILGNKGYPPIHVFTLYGICIMAIVLCNNLKENVRHTGCL